MYSIMDCSSGPQSDRATEIPPLSPDGQSDCGWTIRGSQRVQVGVWYGWFLSAKISVFFKSMGLMQAYKKGKLIHTVAGVV